MSHGKYIGENIKHDHEEVQCRLLRANWKLEEYYENYQKATGNTDEQQKIANQFIWEVHYRRVLC
jgi:hypothetical protein